MAMTAPLHATRHTPHGQVIAAREYVAWGREGSASCTPVRLHRSLVCPDLCAPRAHVGDWRGGRSPPTQAPEGALAVPLSSPVTHEVFFPSRRSAAKGLD